LWLRGEALRLVLMNAGGEIVDARFLHDGERIKENSVIEFPCHKAMIMCRILSVQEMVASMPQKILKSAPGWWLYRSPAEIRQESSSTSSGLQIQRENVQVSSRSAGSVAGPGLLGPSMGDKVGALLATDSVPTLTPQIAAIATSVAAGEKDKRSYKEVLLSPAREVVAVKKKKRWKPTRRKMAHRNQERGGEDRYRREERSDRERNWDMRRDAAGGWDVERHHQSSQDIPSGPFPSATDAVAAEGFLIYFTELWAVIGATGNHHQFFSSKCY
jgi:hypothetical protein